MPFPPVYIYSNSNKQSKLQIIIAALLGTLMSVLVCSVQAGQREEIYARLASDQFNQIEQGISDLATLANSDAAVILQALNDARLFYTPDKKLILKSADQYIDVESGNRLNEAPAGLKSVRINNRLRRTLEAALGSLNLISTDKAIRKTAADAVFKGREAATVFCCYPFIFLPKSRFSDLNTFDCFFTWIFITFSDRT